MIRSVPVSEAQWQAKVIDIAHVYGWLVHHTRAARRVQPAQERWLAALGPHGRLWRPRDEADVVDELRRR